MRIQKKQITETIYLYTLVLILIAAVAYNGGRRYFFTKSDIEVVVSLESVKNIFPEASSFKKNINNTLEVRSGEKEIGKALVSSDFVTDNHGYGGLVPLLIGLDEKNYVEDHVAFFDLICPGCEDLNRPLIDDMLGSSE